MRRWVKSCTLAHLVLWRLGDAVGEGAAWVSDAGGLFWADRCLGAGDHTDRGKSGALAAENQSAYSLPPGKLARAIEYSRKRVVLEFVDTGWGYCS